MLSTCIEVLRHRKAQKGLGEAVLEVGRKGWKEETKAQNETAGRARGHGWKGMEMRRQKDKTAAGRDES